MPVGPWRCQELVRPAIDLAGRVEILPLDRAQQVGLLLGAVGKRIRPRVILELKIERQHHRVVESDRTVEAQFRRAAGKPRQRDAISEYVVNPAQVGRLRGNDEIGVEQPLVVAVPRPQHHAVLAERHRLLVPVGRHMMDGEEVHQSGAVAR